VGQAEPPPSEKTDDLREEIPHQTKGPSEAREGAEHGSGTESASGEHRKKRSEPEWYDVVIDGALIAAALAMVLILGRWRP